MGRFFDALGRRFAQPVPPNAYWLTFFCILPLLLLAMAPLEWRQNEINYFDLALRFVAPERFSPYSAVFDDSAARALSYAILGWLQELVGQNAALAITRLALIAAYALAIARLSCVWGLSAAETVLALAGFLLLGQTYLGGEWLFEGVEAKVPAYVLVIAAIAWASENRHLRAVIALSAATYFHFLVGGYWGAAVLLLMLLKGVPLRRMALLLLAFSAAVLPMFLGLVYERLIVAAPDLSEPGASIDQVYATRNAHHVAPFLNLQQISDWLPGICALLAGTLVILNVASAPGRLPRPRVYWLLALHLYILGALVLAFVDRHSHALAVLYLFRPSALTLLLGLLLLVHWVRGSLKDAGRSISVLALAAFGIFAGPLIPRTGYHLASGPPFLSPDTFRQPDQRALIDWLKAEAAPREVVLLEPTLETDWTTRWIAFERVIGHPMLVSYKFVPTSKADLVRWHDLVRWREAVFAGDCARISEQPVGYLVTVQLATLQALTRCGTVVWQKGDYGVVRTGQTSRLKTGPTRLRRRIWLSSGRTPLGANGASRITMIGQLHQGGRHRRRTF